MPYSQKQWQDRIKDAQGNIIQEGTPFSAGNINRIEQGVADAHAQLEEAARQKQTLIHGVSVLNGGVDAPVNIEIEGRTLIPMQNTVLDPLKYYVLADKKTKVKWADSTIQQGIAKFTAKAERPTLIRVANFEGKISGSTLENPHIVRATTSSTIQSPDGTWATADDATNNYPLYYSLNGSGRPVTTSTNGSYPQQLFVFNLIEEIERNVGRIPRATVADKVQWLKDNLTSLRAKWYGFGSSPGGNKACLTRFNVDSSTWISATTNTSATPTLIALNVNHLNSIDSKGLVHLSAYAETSDGTTASTINTDYVELEIELKPEAILHAPRVPLYEVTKEHYDAINVTMLEDEVLRRYPSVEGVTHLQNPYIMAEGENLLPPFSEWNLHANAKMIGAYELQLDATATTQDSTVSMNILPNTTYTLSMETPNGAIRYSFHDANGTQVGSTIYVTGTFTTPNNARTISVKLYSGSAGTYIFKNIMLTLGSVAKPFTPRNPSYALFETKLAKTGDVADRIFEQDAKYFKRKMIEDVVLDGSLGWAHQTERPGYKVFNCTLNSNSADSMTTTKFNGKSLSHKQGFTASNLTDADQTYLTNSNSFRISVSGIDTGFVESYTPTADEIKAYFNGWKVKTADGANKPTAWVSVVDGTDAPTQTLDYVKANKAANYTPYKLFYVLAAPKVEEIKSEGAISVNGLTQVEVGSGIVVREKVTPASDGGSKRWLNFNQAWAESSKFKNRAERIIAIYKNNTIDKNWIIGAGTAHGKQSASIENTLYDLTAEYYVTYLVFDRQLFTSNPVNVSAQFANNVRSALEDTTKKVEDNTTAISVNTNILYDVLKRLKAGGL